MRLSCTKCLFDPSSPNFAFAFLKLKRERIEIEEKPLAAGGFGAVHKATLIRADGVTECIAVKVFHHRSSRLEEKAAFKLVADVPTFIKYIGDYDPLVQAYDVSPEVFKQKEFILIQLAEGGDLFRVNAHLYFLSERLHGDAARAYTKQVLVNVGRLHEHKIAHRDIKVENFLVQLIPGEPASLLLADAGLVTSEVFSDDCKVGNAHISAPEMRRNGWHDLTKADVWSALLMAAMAVLGNFNLSTAGRFGLQNDYVRGYVLRISLNDPPDLRAAKEFFSRVLVVDPEHRQSAEELLHDPYFFGLEDDVDLGPIFDDLDKRYRQYGGLPFS